MNYLLTLDDNFLLQANTSDGRFDLAISMVCILFSFIISHFIIKKYLNANQGQQTNLNNLKAYLLKRSVFPTVLICTFILNYCRFLLMTSKSSVIYPALIWIVFWMLFIRIVVGCFIYSLPHGKLRTNLGSIIAFFLWVIFLLWWTNSQVLIKQYLKSFVFKLGPIHFTALSLSYAFITLIVVLSLSVWINKLIEIKVNKIISLDSTFRHIILRLSKFIILFITILSILSVLGIDLTTLSIFSGALGIGSRDWFTKIIIQFF